MSHEPQPATPTVNVNLPRRGSSLGIASLILGVVAFAICWIPLLGVLGIPLSALGLLLGAVGVIVAITRRGSGIGFPIAGALTCGLALIVAVSINYALAEGVSAAAKASAQNQVVSRTDSVDSPDSPTLASRSQLSHDDDPPAVPKSTKPQPSIDDTETDATQLLDSEKTEDDAVDVSATESANEPDPEPEWTPASEPVVAGEVQIRITSVTADVVPLRSIGDRTGESKEPALQIQFEVTNLSETRKLNYKTLAGSRVTLLNNGATILDNFGNHYRRIKFSGMVRPQERVEDASVYPGKSITDVLVFEVPVGAIEYLQLTIPLNGVGIEDEIVVRIPKAMIE